MVENWFTWLKLSIQKQEKLNYEVKVKVKSKRVCESEYYSHINNGIKSFFHITSTISASVFQGPAKICINPECSKI